MRNSIRCLIGAALAAALLISGVKDGVAQQRISLIRDAEIEAIIRAYATPLFEAAGLTPSDVGIHLVNDSRLNAFVSNGLNLFLNTGLIQRSETPGQLLGVIAHETGHIAGGHLVRVRDELANATVQALLGAALGAAAAIASGEGGAGAAIMAGSQEMARRGFLQYSRAQESAADHAAMRFLDATGQSSRGLANFLEILSDQELLSTTMQDPYLRTHPITRERVEAVEAHLAQSRYTDAPLPPEWVEAHARMRAKLDGFLSPPAATLARYRADDDSLPARYARAIAYYRQADLKNALPLIDRLIAERPDDPYFVELRGQMLFENGRLAEALPSYQRAVALLPNAPLLRQELARAAIETQDPAWIKQAIVQLNEAVRLDPGSAGTWRLLGIAYGRDGQIGQASLALAESAMLRGAKREARTQAERAQRALQPGSPDWLRADDIKRTAEDKS